MYFRNYGLQKTWLKKCLKSHVSEHPSTVIMLVGHNAAETCALLPYFSITPAEMQFQNFSLSDILNPKTLC